MYTNQEALADARREIAEIEVRNPGPQSLWPNGVVQRYESYRNRADRLAQEVRSERLDSIAPGQAVEQAQPQQRGPNGYYQLGRADGREDCDFALRMIERYNDVDVLSARAADRLDALVRYDDPGSIGAQYLVAVGNPSYNSAFGKMLADPLHGHLRFSPAEVEAVRRVSAVEEIRTLAVGAGGTGGFAIPLSLDPTILMTGAGAINPIRDVANVVTITGSVWKGVSSDGVVAAYAAENAVTTDNSPTLVQPSITPARGQAFVPFSIEVDQDWTAMQSELANLLNDARQVVDATQFLTGNGTNAPGGVLNVGGTGGLTTAQRIQTATLNTTVVNDFYAVKQALGNTRFAANAQWLWNGAVGDFAYRLVPAASTTEPSMFSGGRSGPFLGKPVSEWSTMATATGTTTTKIALYGDWSGFTIVDRLGSSMELIPHLFSQATAFPTGTRGAYFMWRTGSGVTKPSALRYLEVK